MNKNMTALVSAFARIYHIKNSNIKIYNDMYAEKIKSMQSLISPNDKIIFLFNKADKHRMSQYGQNGKPKKLYPSLKE